jgi:hypothetical protein
LIEHFTPKLWDNDAGAMAARNRRAKQLRAMGHSVKCKALDFSGFGYGRDYILEWRGPEDTYIEGRPMTKRKIDSGIDPC